jgi:hypothetical protein
MLTSEHIFQINNATQIQNSDGVAVGDDASLMLSARTFPKLLSWFGLFATKKQADALFNKYDKNKDGFVSLHEFLTLARPADYPIVKFGANDPTVVSRSVIGVAAGQLDEGANVLPRGI